MSAPRARVAAVMSEGATLQQAEETQLREQAAADRYDRRQREVRRSGGDGGVRGPLEFDERGFPLPQRTPSYIERVTRRLLDSR